MVKRQQLSINEEMEGRGQRNGGMKSTPCLNQRRNGRSRGQRNDGMKSTPSLLWRIRMSKQTSRAGKSRGHNLQRTLSNTMYSGTWQRPEAYSFVAQRPPGIEKGQQWVHLHSMISGKK